MTNHRHHPHSDPSPGDPGDAHLDADLRSLAAELDRLGAADRDAIAPHRVEQVCQASVPHLHSAAPMSAQVSELGAIERASAPIDLEARVHEASRGKIRALVGGHPGLRLAGTDADAKPVRRTFWSMGVIRAAAMLTLVASAGLVTWIGTRPSRPTTAQLSAQIERDMEILFAVVDDRTGASVEATESASEPDTQEITEWLFERTSS